MQTDNTAVIVGAFVTIIGAFLAVAKIMLGQATKDREADRAERLKLVEAIDKMASASKDVARATVKSAKEAEQRNGHLGELISSGNELTAKILRQQMDTADIAAEDRENLNSTDQHIDKQIVDKQVVKGSK